MFDGGSVEELEAAVEPLSHGRSHRPCDFVIFDTPGPRRSARPPRRHPRRHAGHADERQLRRFRPDRPGRRRNLQGPPLSFYAELICEARKARAIKDAARDGLGRGAQPRASHRGAQPAAHRRALTELSQARRLPRRARACRERVIYRELFPSGLTLLDKGQLGELGTSHLVARQELRELVAKLHLPGFAQPRRGRLSDGQADRPTPRSPRSSGRWRRGRWPWEPNESRTRAQASVPRAQAARRARRRRARGNYRGPQAFARRWSIRTAAGPTTRCTRRMPRATCCSTNCRTDHEGASMSHQFRPDRPARIRHPRDHRRDSRAGRCARDRPRLRHAAAPGGRQARSRSATTGGSARRCSSTRCAKG